MSAAETLIGAEEQLSIAKLAVSTARQRFLDSPSMENEEAVEEAERQVRRAERFLDARAAAAEREREAEQKRRQSEARAKREELVLERAELERGIQERMTEIRGVYRHLNEIVAALDTLVQMDAAVCQSFNELGAAAADNERQRPLDIELLRLALNAELGGEWDDKPNSNAELTDAVKASAQLDNAGTAADFYRRAEYILAEAEHAFGAAPLCRWLSTLHPPAWDDHSPAAERARQAMQLRERLLKEQNP